MVRPEHFYRLEETSAVDVLRLVADRYGRKIADDIASALSKGERASDVVWPRF